MSRVYTLAIDNALEALVTELGPLRARLVSSAFVFNNSQTVVTGLPGLIGSPAVVTVTGYEGGALKIGTVTFTGVPAGPAVVGILFYFDSNKQLLCHIDTRADYTALSVEPDGGNITFTFDRLLKL